MREKPLQLDPSLPDPFATPPTITMSDSSPKLAPSQGNALVYSTLVAFAAVGFYAGYRVKTKVDFLSGIKTQSGGWSLCCTRDTLTHTAR